MRWDLRSATPTSHTTLAMCFCILQKYGVDMRKGLLVQKLVSRKNELETAFEILNFDQTTTMRKVSEMSELVQRYFKTMQEHLIFRLHTLRRNNEPYELLALMLNPIMCNFASKVIGDVEYKTVRKWVESKLDEVKILAETKQSEEDDDNDASSMEEVEMDESHVKRGISEMALIYSDSQEVTKYFGKSTILSLRKLLNFIQHFDLLDFWSNKHNQTSFPGSYLLSRSTMAYLASTAFVESVSSIAGRLLTPVMSNYSDKTLEAMIVCKAKSHIDRRMTKVKSNMKLSDDETDNEWEEEEE